MAQAAVEQHRRFFGCRVGKRWVQVRRLPGIAAETVATKAGGGEYPDVTALFCTAERCPVIVSNTLVYFDENHLTIQYSQVLGPVLGALADRALTRG